MRFYEVYQGEELQASLIVHDDGRKEWERIRQEGPGGGDLQTAIEQAADADPGCLGATEHKTVLRKALDPKIPNHTPF